MSFTGDPKLDYYLLKEVHGTVSNAAKTLIKMRENMNHRRRMERLLEEAKQARQAMDNCSHGDWTEAIYDPEESMEPYGSKQVGAGSDPYWVSEGYREVKKPRWSRECKKCGKIEYTYTQEPVITGHKPSFK